MKTYRAIAGLTLSSTILLILVCTVAGCGLMGNKPYPINSVVDGPFTVRAECRQITTGTVAPYATVFRHNTEIVSIKVNDGYDLPNDCLKSSIEMVNLDKPTNSLVIRMQDGEVKNVPIIGINLEELAR